jgi:hypothetical protein
MRVLIRQQVYFSQVFCQGWSVPTTDLYQLTPQGGSNMASFLCDK